MIGAAALQTHRGIPARPVPRQAGHPALHASGDHAVLRDEDGAITAQAYAKVDGYRCGARRTGVMIDRIVSRLATSHGHRQRAEPRPWGLWATAGFATVIAAAFIAVQAGTELVFLSMRGLGDGQDAAGDSFGLRVALATIMSAPVGMGLTVLFAAARKGISVRTYLAVNYPASRELWRQLGYLVAFIIAVHVVMLVLDRSIVTPFEQRLYKTAQSPWLLLFAIVLAAPAFEETFLRGFIFQGLLSSLGARGAIALTALLWALLHVQYDLVEISMIFAGGLLLGYARLRTNSILTPITMHSLWNLSSAIETMIYLG